LAQAQELGVPEDELDEFMRLAQDSEAMAEFLSELGLDDDSISAFLDDYSELHDLGLNAAAYDYFIQVGVFLSLLEEAGLTPDDLLDYMMAFENDDDALNALLEDAGIDPDDFFAAFDEAYFETYAALGFSDDELVSFQDAVFLDLLAMAGDDEEMLAELLESYGFSDDDIDLFITAMEDPEAMAALLGEMGFDPEMIEMYDDANDTSDDTSGGGDGSGSGGGDGSGSGGGDDSGGDDGDGDDGGDDSGGSDDSGGTTGG
jgi:tetratricopeptide (TPR) repeat protein